MSSQEQLRDEIKSLTREELIELLEMILQFIQEKRDEPDSD